MLIYVKHIKKIKIFFFLIYVKFYANFMLIYVKNMKIN